MKGLSRLGQTVFQEIKIYLEQDLHTVFDSISLFKDLSLKRLFNNALEHKLACCSKLGVYSYEHLINFILHKTVSLYLSKAFIDLALKQDFKLIKNLFDDIQIFKTRIERSYSVRNTELYSGALLNFFSLFESDDYDELLKGLLKLNVFLNKNIGNINKTLRCSATSSIKTSIFGLISKTN